MTRLCAAGTSGILSLIPQRPARALNAATPNNVETRYTVPSPALSPAGLHRHLEARDVQATSCSPGSRPLTKQRMAPLGVGRTTVRDPATQRPRASRARRTGALPRAKSTRPDRGPRSGSPTAIATGDLPSSQPRVTGRCTPALCQPTSARSARWCSRRSRRQSDLRLSHTVRNVVRDSARPLMPMSAHWVTWAEKPGRSNLTCVTPPRLTHGCRGACGTSEGGDADDPAAPVDDHAIDDRGGRAGSDILGRGQLGVGSSGRQINVSATLDHGASARCGRCADVAGRGFGTV